jgi:hypothetical protein
VPVLKLCRCTGVVLLLIPALLVSPLKGEKNNRFTISMVQKLEFSSVYIRLLPRLWVHRCPFRLHKKFLCSPRPIEGSPESVPGGFV